jgi:adenine deaminase
MQMDASGKELGPHMVGPGRLLGTLRELVEAGLAWGNAVAFATRHIAELLGLTCKDRLAAGSDADVLVLDGNGAVDRVYGSGALLVQSGKALVRGALWGCAMT